MIKVIISTKEAVREKLPDALQGLKIESLSDLSWTDESLGLQDFAWWPEEDQSEPLGKYQYYGDESFELDEANKKVIVKRSVVDWAAEDIQAEKEKERKALIPESVTKRQGRQQMIVLGVLEQVQSAIDGITDPVQRALMQSYWDDSNYYDRYHPQMIALGSQIGFSEEDLDNAFIAASKL